MDVDRPTEVIKKPAFAIFTMLGGALIVVGVFLPWATAPLAYGNTESFNGLTGKAAADGITFLIGGALIAAIGAGRQWAAPNVWIQRAPLLLAGLAAWLAGHDITMIQRNILPNYPYSYVGAGWYVLYLGVGFAALGALVLDRRPLPPLRPLTPPTGYPQPSPPAPITTPTSSVADVPGRPLADWEKEQQREQAEPFLAGETVDWVRLAQVLAVLGAVLGVIAMIGQSVGGGIAIVVCSEICALAMWLVGRRQARAS